jgi:hypothetical protein
MILKQDDLVVTINNTIIRAKKYINPQFVFDPDALQGFYDGVSPKRTEERRPNQWGDFSEPSLLNGRMLTLTGAAIANSPQQLHDMRDEFTGLLIDGVYTEIQVQNSSNSRYLKVTLGGAPAWVQKTDTTAIWKLDLYAPDPRIYGTLRRIQLTDNIDDGGIDYSWDYPLNYGGTIIRQSFAIQNDGNTDSWPIFIVTGDFNGGFTIGNNAGKLIKYEGIVTTAAPVIIDTAAGTATQNGINQSTSLSRRDWFSIPAKQSIQPLFSPSQNTFGWCDIIYRDTWI